MVQLKQYNPNRPARVGAEVYEKYRYRMTVHSQRLLLGLAQSLDLTLDLFPEWHIDIRSLFDYLGIENNNQRYDIVRQAFNEILESPLLYKINEKKWGGYSWFEYVEFDEEDSYFVKVKFTDKVKPFLLNLSRYVELKPRHYIKLSSLYANWLYPPLKAQIHVSQKHFKPGTITEWVVPIARLQEFTFTDSDKSYEESPARFLKSVVGIYKSRATGKWELVQKNVANSKHSGSLAEINEKTDLLVSAEGIKRGKTYHSVRFWIQLKEVEEKEVKKRIDENKAKARNPKQTALFDDKVSEVVNATKAKETKIINKMHISEIHKLVNSSNAAGDKISVEQFAKQAGYVIKGEWAFRYEK